MLKILKNIILFILAIFVLVWIIIFLQSNYIFVKDNIIAFYAWINQQNPMVAGAISLWALGSLSFLAKDIPGRIWVWIVKQSTVTLTINNADDIYDHFLTWYQESGRSAKARTLVARGVRKKIVGVSITANNSIGKTITKDLPLDISAGYGTHYFVYGLRIFQLSRVEKEANATTQVKEALTLKTIGRSQTHFHKLITEMVPEKDDMDLTTIYKWNSRDDWWKSFGSQMSRKFASVIIPTEKKSAIVEHIETFLGERDWYIEHGIPYRTGVILHGVPGTGKTSFVQALCTKFNKSLYVLALSGLSDNGVEEAFKEVPKNSIILLEDLDTYTVVGNRSVLNNEEATFLQTLTLSGLLNAIDGVIASEGRILIATTNHLEKIDPALCRTGRFNLKVELTYLTQECFIEFFKKFYPDFKIEGGVKFKPEVTPASLQALILDNRRNPQVVLNEVRV